MRDDRMGEVTINRVFLPRFLMATITRHLTYFCFKCPYSLNVRVTSKIDLAHKAHLCTFFFSFSFF